jgi:hypothetical protein
LNQLVHPLDQGVRQGFHRGLLSVAGVTERGFFPILTHANRPDTKRRAKYLLSARLEE